MSAASAYTMENVINSLLRGEPFPVPTDVYVALHTSNPGVSGGNEVQTTSWPSYRRMDSTEGGALADAWSAPDGGVSRNQHQMIYPVYDGTGALTVTHFSLWDASEGGNMLMFAPLTSSRTIQTADVFVLDIEKLTVRVL